MSQWYILRNKGDFLHFLKIALFCEEFVNSLFDGSTFESMFNNLNFNIQHFDVKNISSKSKNYKNYQNHFITNNGVIWSISKMIKIRDLGWKVSFLWCVFEYVSLV